jgi:hypothetical protein
MYCQRLSKGLQFTSKYSADTYTIPGLTAREYLAGSGWWKILKGIRIVRTNGDGWCLACFPGGKIGEVI